MLRILKAETVSGLGYLMSAHEHTLCLVNDEMTDDDMKYLEEPYVPHSLEGVMADNQPAMRDEPVLVAAARDIRPIRIGRTFFSF